MLSHAYNIIIYRPVGSPGNCREVVDVLNYTYKRFLSALMMNVQVSGIEAYNKQMEMHTSTVNKEISLAKGFKKYLSKPTLKYGVIYQDKERKCSSK